MNLLRFTTLNAKCGGNDDLTQSKQFDLASLPPCRSVLEQHVLRSNFQTRIWKLANIPKPSVPRADEGHGWIQEDGVMMPKWTEGEVMPRQLIDLLGDELESENKSDSDSDSESELGDDHLLDKVESSQIMTLTLIDSIKMQSIINQLEVTERLKTPDKSLSGKYNAGLQI